MILIVGATGRLGQALTTRLLADGLAVRAACRNPAKAGNLAAAGAEVVTIDVVSGQGVAAAMAGADQVVTCLHGLVGRSPQSIANVDVRGHERLIDAAIAAGVARFVYLSALGAAPDHPSEFWRAKAQVEDYLKRSNLNFVILRPAAFMDLYAHDLIGAAVLRDRTVWLLGDPGIARNMVAVADVAAAAAYALQHSELSGMTADVTGPANVTDREVAAMYGRLAGRKAKVRALPSPMVRSLAAAIHPFHAGVARVLRLPRLLAGRHDLCADPRLSTSPLLLQPMSVEQFAREKMQDRVRLSPNGDRPPVNRQSNGSG